MLIFSVNHAASNAAEEVPFTTDQDLTLINEDEVLFTSDSRVLFASTARVPLIEARRAPFTAACVQESSADSDPVLSTDSKNSR